MGKVDKSKEDKLPATSPDKCPRVWEKARRDRLKVLFDELSRLLPKYDPAEPPSRPNIIQKAIEHIRDLQAQNEDLLKGGFDQVYKNKLDSWKKRVKNLVNRVEQLSDVLRTAKIHLPPLALEPIPGWAHTRPKHWSNKINLPQQQLQQVISSLTKKPRSKSGPSRKRKIVFKENQPEKSPKLSKRVKKAKVIKPFTDESQKNVPIVSQSTSVTTQIQPSTQNLPSFIQTTPQPSTYILTEQGNLVPILAPSVLTPVIINRPPVLLMQTPLPPKPAAVFPKSPDNKRRIDRESTVMTFANKKPIPALSQQSHPRRGGKCIAHKTRKTDSKNLMPVVCKNTPAVSPTATFLSSFPVVSTPKFADSESATAEDSNNSCKLEKLSGDTADRSAVDKEATPIESINLTASNSTGDPVVSTKKLEDKSNIDDTEVVFTLNLASQENTSITASKDIDPMSNKDPNLPQENVNTNSDKNTSSDVMATMSVPEAVDVKSPVAATSNASKDASGIATKLDAPSSQTPLNTQEQNAHDESVHGNVGEIAPQDKVKPAGDVKTTDLSTASASESVPASSYNVPRSSLTKDTISQHAIGQNLVEPIGNTVPGHPEIGGFPSCSNTFGNSASNLATSSAPGNISHQVGCQILGDGIKNVPTEFTAALTTSAASRSSTYVTSVNNLMASSVPARISHLVTGEHSGNIQNVYPRPEKSSISNTYVTSASNLVACSVPASISHGVSGENSGNVQNVHPRPEKSSISNTYVTSARNLVASSVPASISHEVPGESSGNIQNVHPRPEITSISNTYVTSASNLVATSVSASISHEVTGENSGNIQNVHPRPEITSISKTYMTSASNLVASSTPTKIPQPTSQTMVKNVVPESRTEVPSSTPSCAKTLEGKVTTTNTIATTTIAWSSSLPILSKSSTKNSWLPLPPISSTSWRCSEPVWNPPANQPDPWTIPHHTSVTSVQFSNASTFVNTSLGPQTLTDPWGQGPQGYSYLGDAYTPTKTDSYVSIPNFAVTSASGVASTSRAVWNSKSSSGATYTTLNTVKRSESFYVPPLSEPWCVPSTAPTKLSTNYGNAISLSPQKEAFFLTTKPPNSNAMTLVNSKIDEPWKTPTFVQTNDQSSWKITSSVNFYSSTTAPINSIPPTSIARKNFEDSYLKSSAASVGTSTNSSIRNVTSCIAPEPEPWKTGYLQNTLPPITSKPPKIITPWKDNPQNVKTSDSTIPFLGTPISHLPKNSQNPPETFIPSTSHPSRKSGNTEHKQAFVADSWGNRHPDPFSAVLPQYQQQDRVQSDLQKQSYQYDNFVEPYLPNFSNCPPGDLKAQYSTPQTPQKASPLSKTFPPLTSSASIASVTSIHSLLTVSNASSQTKPIFSSVNTKPICSEIYFTPSHSQDSTFGNFQFVPSSTSFTTSLPSDVASSVLPQEAKGLKKEKRDNVASKAKIAEKPRIEAKNAGSDKIVDTSGLWNNQYLPQITGNETPWADFTMEGRDARPKPPVNWMTETDQRTEMVQFPSEDPFQSSYQNVFDRKGHNLLDFLNNPLDHEVGKKKKDDLITQDYFGWMSMKVDGLVPSTLPTLVGDLALGNDITPTKRNKQEYQPTIPGKNKMSHDYQPEKHKMEEFTQMPQEKMKVNYQPMPIEKHKTIQEYPAAPSDKSDHAQEPFTNLSKNIFEISESSKDSETIVLKNIFELPTVQPTKQRTNIGQNSFLSVSQLVEPNIGHQEVAQKNPNYTYYPQPTEKVENWKCAEKKCQQKSRSNYSAEALLRPETMSSGHEVPPITPYTEYTNMTKPMTGRQRKPDYYRGQEVKTAKNRASKKPQEFPQPPPQHSLPRFSNASTSYLPTTPLVPPTTFSYSEPPILSTNTYVSTPSRHASYPKPDTIYHYPPIQTTPAAANRSQQAKPTEPVNQPSLYSPNTRLSTGVPRQKHPIPPVSSSNYPLPLSCSNNARPQQNLLGAPWTPLAAQPQGSSGSSLANFNLTTIFPEMNKKGYQYT